MRTSVLGIQVNAGTIRLLLLMGEWEQARVTLSAELEWEEVWRMVEVLCASSLMAPCIVLFAAGVPRGCGWTLSVHCGDEDCSDLHTDCTAAAREFAELGERVRQVFPCR